MKFGRNFEWKLRKFGEIWWNFADLGSIWGNLMEIWDFWRQIGAEKEKIGKMGKFWGEKSEILGLFDQK